jgi:hypothetical protein
MAHDSGIGLALQEKRYNVHREHSRVEWKLGAKVKPIGKIRNRKLWGRKDT